MNVNSTTLLIILGCTIVTVIPRILPFIIVRNVALPQPVLKWLSYVPICILTALVVENFIIHTEQGLKIDWTVISIIVPTALIAIWTKSLSLTVIVGVLLMAVIRYFIF
ncbi:AzlD domain-containing protein [Priestia endophytica]|uniref:AzlD domain-containing protein n=1 Tax=Priestia endophytica TaxID=135735 RepID=UPI00124E43A9|nr:AzlD domain-containing protein [Priestia endophytica]KAB2495298.1 AzlD domain-containing protein [Priestia endophytica]